MLSIGTLWSQKTTIFEVDESSLGAVPKVKLLGPVIKPESNINHKKNLSQLIQNESGSFLLSMKGNNLELDEVIEFVSKELNLETQHSFEIIRNEKDNDAGLHVYYQYKFDGYPVEGSIIGVHLKDGLVETITASPLPW